MNKDEEAFEDWLTNLPNNEMYLSHKEMMLLAWKETIKYEQNKPIRTYRWNGVLQEVFESENSFFSYSRHSVHFI